MVTAIKLMPYGDSSYPYMMPLLEFAVQRYFDFATLLANYDGGSGDSIAGIVEKLARLYTGSNQPQRAIALIERLLSAREPDINDHTLEFLALQHARALVRAGRQAEAIAVLRTAIANYHGDWEPKLQKQLAKYEAEG